MQLYSGAALPRQQVAKTSCRVPKERSLWQASIRVVDGTELPGSVWWQTYPLEVYVLPGEHTVLARQTDRTGGGLSGLASEAVVKTWDTPLSFKAESGARLYDTM